MKEQERTDPRRWWQLPNLWLLSCLACFFLVYPVLTRTGYSGRVFDALLSASIVLALYAQTEYPRKIRTAFLFLGFLSVLASWAPTETLKLDIIPPLLYTCFFGISFSMFCHKLFTDTEVDVDTLLAAACAYVLLGFFFSTIYLAMMVMDPGSFSVPDSNVERLYVMIYFSFVTLTTLGYGDVLPVSPSAQMLAVMEAIVGQIFVTVVVAELVGIHVARSRRG